MKKYFFVLFAVVLSGCDQTTQQSKKDWKPIEVGGYVFDFPSDYELVEGKGVDSYVGEVRGEDLVFEFDYGHYSNRLEQTPQEYLKEGLWKQEISYKFMKEGVKYDDASMPKIEVLNIRPATHNDGKLGKNVDFIVTGIHENKKFVYPLSIPKEIKAVDIVVDTIDGYRRKIVFSKESFGGYTGMHIIRLDTSNAAEYDYLALTMTTQTKTRRQQGLALKILKTGRGITRQLNKQ